LLGPELLGQATTGSMIYYAPTSEMFLERAIEELCAMAGGCDPLPEPEATELNGRRAWIATIGGTGTPAVEWTFVDNEEMFVFFTIHDPETQETLPSVVESVHFMPVRDEAGRAEQMGLMARQLLLQQLQVNWDEIEIANVEAVEWSDACLGIANPAVLCAVVITPGYRITLEVDGETYVFHTDAEGRQVLPAEAPEPQIGDLLLEWEQNTDWCNQAQFGTEGIAFGRCYGVLLQGTYVGEREAQLQEYIETYAPFSADTLVAGVVTFHGQGTQAATPAVQRMIAEWAAQVQMEAAAGRTAASLGLAMHWEREGGIAGFCDRLSVYYTGRIYATACGGEQLEEIGERVLTAGEAEQLFAYLDRFGQVEYAHTDPATADAMTIYLLFTGFGAEQPTEAEQQELLDFAQDLFNTFAQ
jgi:hypothetical protein